MKRFMPTVILFETGGTQPRRSITTKDTLSWKPRTSEMQTAKYWSRRSVTSEPFHSKEKRK